LLGTATTLEKQKRNRNSPMADGLPLCYPTHRTKDKNVRWMGHPAQL
jgi:hypothetical protein